MEKFLGDSFPWKYCLERTPIKYPVPDGQRVVDVNALHELIDDSDDVLEEDYSEKPDVGWIHRHKTTYRQPHGDFLVDARLFLDLPSGCSPQVEQGENEKVGKMALLFTINYERVKKEYFALKKYENEFCLASRNHAAQPLSAERLYGMHQRWFQGSLKSFELFAGKSATAQLLLDLERILKDVQKSRV